MKNTSCVILVGGMGTRLCKLDRSMPKAFFHVGGKPLIYNQISQIKNNGITDIIFAVCYMSEYFMTDLGDGSRFGMNFKYSIEKEPLGTGGAIQAAAQIGLRNTFVMNGDIYSNINLNEIELCMEQHQSDAVVSMVTVNNSSEYGSMSCDADDRIICFSEKSSKTNTINAGVYLLTKKIIDMIPSNHKVSFERETIPAVLKANHILTAHRHHGFWFDIGTPERYKKAKEHADQ